MRIRVDGPKSGPLFADTLTELLTEIRALSEWLPQFHPLTRISLQFQRYEHRYDSRDKISSGIAALHYSTPSHRTSRLTHNKWRADILVNWSLSKLDVYGVFDFLVCGLKTKWGGFLCTMLCRISFCLQLFHLHIQIHKFRWQNILRTLHDHLTCVADSDQDRFRSRPLVRCSSVRWQLHELNSNDCLSMFTSCGKTWQWLFRNHPCRSE